MYRYTYSSSKEEMDSCRGSASWMASANFSKFHLNSSGWFLNEFLRLASKTSAIVFLKWKLNDSVLSTQLTNINWTGNTQVDVPLVKC